MRSKQKKPQKIVISRDKFIESVYHVVYFGNIARSIKEVYLDIENKVSEYELQIIRFSMQWQVMIMAISMQDELNKYLFSYRCKDQEVKNRIAQYKYIVTPMISEINSWSDLRTFRNNVLAHNFRIDKEQYISVGLNNRLNDYNVPQFRIDFILLLKYIDAITKIAEEIFSPEYIEAQSVIHGFAEKEKKLNDINDKVERSKRVINEVNKRANEYNLTP